MHQKFKDHLLEIGLFETLAATKMPTNVSQLSCSTSDGDVSPAACASQKIESSDDDFDKITHEDVAAVAEQFAIPSVNTKYKGLHL